MICYSPRSIWVCKVVSSIRSSDFTIGIWAGPLTRVTLLVPGSLYAVFDGHGPFGHVVSLKLVQYVPYFALSDPNLLKNPREALARASADASSCSFIVCVFKLKWVVLCELDVLNHTDSVAPHPPLPRYPTQAWSLQINILDWVLAPSWAGHRGSRRLKRSWRTLPRMKVSTFMWVVHLDPSAWSLWPKLS